MTQTYNADAIEVLTGLEPVRRRPGMYTDTTRPNHLGQEVIDNSVDEALAGHAKRVDVILHADQSLEVIDDGRGMPVDIHPEEGVPGSLRSLGSNLYGPCSGLIFSGGQEAHKSKKMITCLNQLLKS